MCKLLKTTTYSIGQNRDPIGEEGGINLFAFVQNRAVNALDWLGLVDDPQKFLPWNTGDRIGPHPPAHPYSDDPNYGDIWTFAKPGLEYYAKEERDNLFDGYPVKDPPPNRGYYFDRKDDNDRNAWLKALGIVGKLGLQALVDQKVNFRSPKFEFGRKVDDKHRQFQLGVGCGGGWGNHKDKNGNAPFGVGIVGGLWY